MMFCRHLSFYSIFAGKNSIKIVFQIHAAPNNRYRTKNEVKRLEERSNEKYKKKKEWHAIKKGKKNKNKKKESNVYTIFIRFPLAEASNYFSFWFALRFECKINSGENEFMCLSKEQCDPFCSRCCFFSNFFFLSTKKN